MRLAASVLAACVLLPAQAAPGVVVVLDDGESVRGISVRREGEQLAVTVGADERILVPAARVVEIRPVDEGRPSKPEPAATGLVRRQARQLAGNRVEPETPREQTAALGMPARFIPDPSPRRPWPRADWPGDVAAGNNFAPSSWAEDPIDPRWKPRSGLRPEDALAPSRGRWASPAGLAEWDPSDAWKERRATFGTSTVPRMPRGRLGLPEQVEACGHRIAAGDPGGRAEGLRVAPLDGRPWDALPVRLYTVERRGAGHLRRTVFAVEGEICRPLAGDLAAAATTLPRYNRAVLAAARPLPVGEPVARALAIATLLDPAAMGAARDRRVLLGAAADLDRLAGEDPLACELSSEARQRIHALARRAVTPPESAAGADGQSVAFWTWSPRGGVLSHHVVRTAPGGSVTVETEALAHHLGDHRDDPGPRPTLAAR